MNPEHVTPKPAKLDYSTLTIPVTNTDIRTLKIRLRAESSVSWHKSELANLVFILSVSIVPLVIALIFVWLNQHNYVVLAVLVVVMAVGVFSVYNELILKPRKLVKLYRFADANSLTVVRCINDPDYSGMIFDEGHSRQIPEALRFTSGVEIGNYQYVTGSGKNRQTHVYAYAKVPLGRHLPHIVLDARQNNFLGMSNLPDTFKANQRLELEGDFNKHFNLYAPKQYERDALYIFTPDVMATMIDNGERYDMEIVDDMLYIYSQESLDLLSAGRLEPLLAVVDTISRDVSKQTIHYRDDRVGDRTHDVVAVPGQRLKQGFNLAMVVLVVAVFGAQIASTVWPDTAWILPLLVVVTLWVFILGSIIKRLRK